MQNKLYPENYKSYFKEIATECEVHPDLVEELVRFFYGNIRKNLENLKSLGFAPSGTLEVSY